MHRPSSLSDPRERIPDADPAAAPPPLVDELAAAHARIRALTGELDAARAELARQADALERATHAAETANEAKERFIANVSHELRTPLSAILLWSSLIDERKVADRELEEALDAIKRSAEEQSALIDDIVDTSRLLAGKLRLEPEDVDLAEVVHAALGGFADAAREKNVALVERLEPAAVPDRGDARRLRQLVGHLVGNALKSTPAGGTVTVTLRRDDTAADLVVTDTGAGLPQEELAALFLRRPSLDGKCARSGIGLGIGLVLAREIVRLHGGTLTAASDGPGRGAEFRARLPRAGSDPAEPQGADARLLAGRRVLLADPSPDTGTLIGGWLQEAGARVDAASATDAAWNHFCAFPPNLVLARVGPGGVDGCELMRRIREREGAAGTGVPAIAIMGGEDDRLLERALEAGFQTTLLLPLDPRQLFSTLNALANRTHAGDA